MTNSRLLQSPLRNRPSPPSNTPTEDTPIQPSPRLRAFSDPLLELPSTQYSTESSKEDLFSPSTGTTSPFTPTPVLMPCFSEYLRTLLHPPPTAKTPNGDTRSERVFNFFHVPFQLEKTLWLGYFVCLDSFLDTLIILPFQFCIAIGTLLSFRPLKDRKVDLWKGFLFLLALYALLQMDPSILYHDVRGQSMLKLYVVFNLLEVCDKLCSSFGADILDSLYARPTSTSDHHFAFPIHFGLAFLYMVIHSIVFFYQLITLNVAINSYSTTLITLLISNQFVEIKSSVFKRFESENLFQLTSADMVERMNLSLFLFLNGMRNWAEQMDAVSVVELALPLLAVFACEILVDWLKHAFITKFNILPSTVYRQFRWAVLSSPHPLARKLGFSPLPLTVLFVRMCLDLRLDWKPSTVVFLCLLLLKLRLGYTLLLSRIKTSRKQGNALKSLGKIDRYTLVKSRIP